MASIKKLADRKYFVRVSKGRGKSRQYINETIRGTLADAKQFARKNETLLDLGYTPDEVTLTFARHFTAWLKAVRPTIASRTYEGYDEYIRRYALTTLGPLKVSGIKAAHIQTIYDKMIESGLSSTTVRNLHASIRVCFAHAVRQSYCRKNPCMDVDLPQKTRAAITIINLDQAPRFIEACQDKKNGLIFEFALETGMRPEEYLALRWRDIDFERITASVNQVVVYARNGGGFTFNKCKTAKSRRLVPLSKILRDKLIPHQKAQIVRRSHLRVSYADLDLVFANDIGNPYSLNNLSRRYLAPILESCGLDKTGLSPYSLRHSCATILLMLGENPKVVADRLGHASVVMTLDTYSHVLPHIQAAATDKMDQALRRRGD